MGAVVTAGHFPLQLGDFGAQNKILPVQDAADVGLHLFADGFVLRF